ncbi:unnamed protein product [Vicia faba]|uniref:RRM domain-containing protein n=1 Tax=Vicia faba TaxID=3906 RepID=A0AAV0ZG94_VICFA|nr:unnamed protein product [Vicia faba]
MSSYSRRSRYSPSPSPLSYRRYGRSLSRSLSRSRSRSRLRSVSRDAENPGNNLYVTGLSPRITKRELEKHFAAEGKVIDVHLVVDPWTRESRGFGFVTMDTLEEADRCVKYLDRSVLEGRVIMVEKARRRRGRTPTPGKYLGLRTTRGDSVVPQATLLDVLLAILLIEEATVDHLLIVVEVALTLLTIGEGHPTLLNTGEGHPTLLNTREGGHTRHTLADTGHTIVMIDTGHIPGLALLTAGLLSVSRSVSPKPRKRSGRSHSRSSRRSGGYSKHKYSRSRSSSVRASSRSFSRSNTPGSTSPSN